MKLITVISLSLMLIATALANDEEGYCEDSNCEGNLLVGAFNVQVFGQSKSGKEDVMHYLVKILSRYDLVVVQEIRDSKQTAFPALVDQLNQEYGDLYEYTISERTGRSSSKEQYGFIFRRDKLRVRGAYESPDVTDVFEREPLVVRFARTTEVGRQREFTFIPIHAKPSDAVAEMDHLVDVYNSSVHVYGPDAVIAGDFNADCSYVCKGCWGDIKLRTDPRFKWLIDDDADTTVGSSDCAYDRVVVAGDEMQANSCCAKIFRYDLEYDLDQEMAKDISDHYPVEFTIY